jgi:Beta-propeller repeat/PASTA domain
MLALLLALLTALSVSGAAGTTGPKQARQALAESSARQAALGSYRALPLAFVPNAGQLDRRVRYSARAGGASVFLARREVVLALAKGRRGLTLQLSFLGADASPEISGAERTPGRVNYLIGNDPSRWRRNLPTYAEVVYRGLWPSIDLALRGRGGQLKYEFRLAPGADPARIRLAYRGQERLSLRGDGALRVETALGILPDGRPVSYQPIAGRRVPVASRFALGSGGAHGFALGTYDPRYPLVIDPGLVYSTYLGGRANDFGEAIAVDGAGSAYVTGSTDSANFPTSAGAFDRRLGGRLLDDVFVAKLNPAGSALAYSTYLGGSRIDRGRGIAVDGAGNAYVAGATRSTNFPTSAGAFDKTYNTHGDAFVTKLSADGSSLFYSIYLGGSASDGAAGIAIDKAGSMHVTGSTFSTDFPTTADAFDRSSNGRYDAFVAKLNADGSDLTYSTYLGGSGTAQKGAGLDGGTGIAVDDSGSAYIVGSTNSRDFPTTAGSFATSRSGKGFDAFVTKLDAAGSSLGYSTYLGGGDGAGIAVDGAGNAYVTGSTDSANFPTTTGAFDRSLGPFFAPDAFVTKLNRAGSALAYSTYLGAGSLEYGYAIAIAVDGAGSAYVTGSTDSKFFPTTADAFDRRFGGGDFDAFVTKLNATGSALAYSTFLGGRGDEDGIAIAIEGVARAYVTGETDSRNFTTTANAFDRRYNRGEFGDAFVTKLDVNAGRARCWVPHVIGMPLAKAKRTIHAMVCSVGRIRRVHSQRDGRVLAQNPRAGAVRSRGFKVNLVVGRSHL